MFERSEDLLLPRQAFRGPVAPQRRSRQPHRDATFHQAVGPLGEPYGAHAALSDERQEPVGPTSVPVTIVGRSSTDIAETGRSSVV